MRAEQEAAAEAERAAAEKEARRAERERKRIEADIVTEEIAAEKELLDGLRAAQAERREERARASQEEEEAKSGGGGEAEAEGAHPREEHSAGTMPPHTPLTPYATSATHFTQAWMYKAAPPRTGRNGGSRSPNTAA